jgi:hypothetical protein
MADPFMVAILVVLLVLIFFAYLLLRRTVVGFKQGVKEGSDDP